MAKRVEVQVVRRYEVGEGEEAYSQTEPTFLEAQRIAWEQGLDVFNWKRCRSGFDFDTDTYLFEQRGE